MPSSRERRKRWALRMLRYTNKSETFSAGNWRGAGEVCEMLLSSHANSRETLEVAKTILKFIIKLSQVVKVARAKWLDGNRGRKLWERQKVSNGKKLEIEVQTEKLAWTRQISNRFASLDWKLFAEQGRIKTRTGNHVRWCINKRLWSAQEIKTVVSWVNRMCSAAASFHSVQH